MTPEENDEDRSRPVNATRRGRYGDAPPDEPHLSPETAPIRGDDFEARLPEAQPGALPENEGVDEEREGD